MHLVAIYLTLRYSGCSLWALGTVTCRAACPSSTSTISLPCLASYCWSASETIFDILHLSALPQCFITLAMLSTSNVYILINFTSFVESFFITLSVGGLLYLRYYVATAQPFPTCHYRWKQPDLERPIKVNIVLPIVFFVVCSFLILMPIFEEPEVSTWKV